MLEKHLKKIIALSIAVVLTVTVVALYDFESYEPYLEPYYEEYDVEYIRAQTHSIILHRALAEHLCETEYGGIFIDDDGTLNIWAVDESGVEYAIETAVYELEHTIAVMEMRENIAEGYFPIAAMSSRDVEQYEILQKSMTESPAEELARLRQNIYSEEVLDRIVEIEMNYVIELLFEPCIIAEALEQDVIIFDADFSLQELSEAQDAIMDIADELEQEGIYAATVCELNNSLIIKTSDTSDHTIKILYDILECVEMVELEEVEGRLDRIPHTTISNGSGFSTVGAWAGSITTGITYTHNGVVRNGFLTHGHINGPLGARAYHSCSIHIGRVDFKIENWFGAANNNGGLDFGFIRRENTNVHSTNMFRNGTVFPNGREVFAGGFATGTQVTAHGSASGTRHGSIQGTTFSGFVGTNLSSRTGDSGGPVTTRLIYNSVTGATRTVIIGIHVGDWDGWGVFTCINRARNHRSFTSHVSNWR